MRKRFVLSIALLILGLGVPPQAESRDTRRAQAAGDLQVVAGPIAEKVTSNSAVVWWQTTAPGQTTLVYGTAPDELHQRVQRPWSTTTHEVSLRKLQPNTTYYVTVLQPDGATAAKGQFTTEPLDYAAQDNVRITNGPLFEQIKPDSATIAWSTNLPSSSVIHYGTDPNHLDKTEKAPWTPTTHRVVLRGLEPDTHYYFTIESAQPPAESQQPSVSPLTTESGEPTPSLPAAQTYAFRTLARGQQAVNIGPGH